MNAMTQRRDVRQKTETFGRIAEVSLEDITLVTISIARTTQIGIQPVDRDIGAAVDAAALPRMTKSHPLAGPILPVARVVRGPQDTALADSRIVLQREVRRVSAMRPPVTVVMAVARPAQMRRADAPRIRTNAVVTTAPTVPRAVPDPFPLSTPDVMTIGRIGAPIMEAWAHAAVQRADK